MSVWNGTPTKNIDISQSDTTKLYATRNSRAQWSQTYGKAYFVVAENTLEGTAKSFYLTAVSPAGQRCFLTEVSTAAFDWSNEEIPPAKVFVDTLGGRIWVAYYDPAYSSGIRIKTFHPETGALIDTKSVALSYGTGPFYLSDIDVQGEGWREVVIFTYGSATGGIACAQVWRETITLNKEWGIESAASSPQYFTLTKPATDSTGNMFFTWEKNDGSAAYFAKFYFTGILAKENVINPSPYTYIWISDPVIWGTNAAANIKLCSDSNIDAEVVVGDIATFTLTFVVYMHTNCWWNLIFYGTPANPYKSYSEWYSGAEYIPPPILLSNGKLFLIGSHPSRMTTTDDTTESYYPYLHLNDWLAPVYLKCCSVAVVDGVQRPIVKGDILWSYRYWGPNPEDLHRVQITVNSDPIYIKGKYEDLTAVLYFASTVTLQDDVTDDPNAPIYAGTGGFHLTVEAGGVRSSTADIMGYWDWEYYRFREWNYNSATYESPGWINRNILNTDLTLQWPDIDAFDTRIDYAGGRVWGINHVACIPSDLQISGDQKLIVFSLVADQEVYVDGLQPKVDSWTDDEGSHSQTYQRVMTGLFYQFDEDGAFAGVAGSLQANCYDSIVDYYTFIYSPAGRVEGIIDHSHEIFYPTRMAAPHTPDPTLVPYYNQLYLESMPPFSAPVLSDCGGFFISGRLGYVYYYGNPDCCGVAVGNSALIHQDTGIVTHSAECHVGDTVLFDPRTGTIQRSCPSVSVGEFVRWDAKKGTARKSN